MILTRKRLLVVIFFTRSSSKSLAFCEFASVNFEPWQYPYIMEGTFNVHLREKMPLSFIKRKRMGNWIEITGVLKEGGKHFPLLIKNLID